MEEHDKGFVAGYLCAIQNGISHNHLSYHQAALLLKDTNIPHEEWVMAQEDTGHLMGIMEEVFDQAFFN